MIITFSLSLSLSSYTTLGHATPTPTYNDANTARYFRNYRRGISLSLSLSLFP